MHYGKLLATMPLLTALGCTSLQNKEKPNVVLIMADDMGYSGITPFGGINLETPALDWLASNGVLCTNFHTNAPVCSPTRVSIMTGSYQQRAGLNHIYPENDPSDGLDPATHPSFAIQLKEAGYHTGVFGKWHMGMDEKFNPVNHGFDEFGGFLKGNVDFISHMNTTPEVDWWHNNIMENQRGYATDLINQYSVDFIKESEGQPFFLYVPQAAIHTPIQGRNDPPIRTDSTYMYDNGRNMPVEEYERRYREMIKVLDEGVQMIIDELNRQGILDKTMIIFISDNGAEATAAQKYPGANGYFHGSKAQLYEGGIRVPAIFYYPKLLKHKYTDELMLTMDLMPTILEFCNVENSRIIDGTSLLPTLVNNEPMPERDVFWANGTAVAMQSGEWKIVWQRRRMTFNQNNPQEPSSEVSYTVELYNMMIDPKEQYDVSSIYPEKAESMRVAAENWWNEVTAGTRLEGTSPVGMQAPPPSPVPATE
jgi:arylsulfatase A